MGVAGGAGLVPAISSLDPRCWIPLQEPGSVFQSLFIVANGFAQNPESRPVVQAPVMAKDADWDACVYHMSGKMSVIEVSRDALSGKLERTGDRNLASRLKSSRSRYVPVGRHFVAFGVFSVSKNQ